MLSLECGGEVERLEKRLPDVNILLMNSEEQRIVVETATELIAVLGLNADGIDPHECERPIFGL